MSGLSAGGSCVDKCLMASEGDSRIAPTGEKWDGREFTLTLALSHRGRGDKTPPVNPLYFDGLGTSGSTSWLGIPSSQGGFSMPGYGNDGRRGMDSGSGAGITEKGGDHPHPSRELYITALSEPGSSSLSSTSLRPWFIYAILAGLGHPFLLILRRAPARGGSSTARAAVAHPRRDIDRPNRG